MDNSINAPATKTINDLAEIEKLMSHVTLSRVSGSHFGQFVYVFYDGKEIGECYQPRQGADGPDQDWQVSYTSGRFDVRLPCCFDDYIGAVRIAQHHVALLQETLKVLA